MLSNYKKQNKNKTKKGQWKMYDPYIMIIPCGCRPRYSDVVCLLEILIYDIKPRFDLTTRDTFGDPGPRAS